MKKQLTDIHTHILYGIDEGVSDLEESFKMLELQVKQGVHRVILTPHFVSGNKNTAAIQIYEHFLMLKNRALLKKIPIEILLGSELYYNERLVQELQEGNAFSMDDTRYLLVEFDIETEFNDMMEGLKKLMLLGFLPILAHVEKYQWIQKKS